LICVLVAETNTLLTYETGWQVRYFEPMVQSQLAGNYPQACQYGIAFLTILGIPEKDFPKKETPFSKSAQAEIGTWMDYYNNIMLMSAGQIRATIVDVRNKYRRQQDIPQYNKPQEIRK